MAVTDVLPRPRRISPTSSVERPAHGSPTYAGEAEWQSARVVDIRLDGCLAAKFEEIAANQRLLQDAARQSASKCDAMARRISRLEAQQEGAKADLSSKIEEMRGFAPADAGAHGAIHEIMTERFSAVEQLLVKMDSALSAIVTEQARCVVERDVTALWEAIDRAAPTSEGAPAVSTSPRAAEPEGPRMPTTLRTASRSPSDPSMRPSSSLRSSMAVGSPVDGSTLRHSSIAAIPVGSPKWATTAPRASLGGSSTVPHPTQGWSRARTPTAVRSTRLCLDGASSAEKPANFVGSAVGLFLASQSGA